MPEEPTQPTYPQTGVQITPDGLVISTVLSPTLTINQGINVQSFNQVVRAWLQMHPELLKELAKEAAEAKKAELAVIKHVKASRND